MAKAFRVTLLMDTADGFGLPILDGIADHVRARCNWDITPATIPASQHPQVIRSFRGDGMIVSCSTPATSEAACAARYPLVNVAGSSPPVPPVSVLGDDQAAGHMAATHLLSRGVRRFASIVPDRHFTAERHAGFEAAMKAARCEVARFPSPAAFIRVLPELVKPEPLPLGLFCPGDAEGFEVIRHCRAMHIAIPQRLAIVAVGGYSPLTRLCTPTLSCVLSDLFQRGRRAAQLLDDLLHGCERPRRPLLIPPLAVAEAGSTDVLGYADEAVRRAIGYIRERYGEPIDASDVAAAGELSRRALEMRFRRHVGRGIAAELTRYRLERASELLKATSLPLANIAARCGFASHAAFTVAYKRELGVNPSDCRS